MFLRHVEAQDARMFRSPIESRKHSPSARWIRTGFSLAEQQADPTLEVKFNPYHDPTNGQFTFGPGGGSAAGMTRPPQATTTEQG